MKSLKAKLIAGFAAASTSTVLFAADHSTAIDAAYLDGNTNVTTAVVGLIGLMAVIVGVGAIIGLFRKG